MIGIAASPGIVIGRVFVFEKVELVFDNTKIDNDKVQYELDRVEEAKYKTKDQIEQIYKDTVDKLGESEAKIFEAHLMLIDDPILEQKITDYIKDDLYVSETAVDMAMKDVSEMFKNLGDEYLKERAADVIDVCTRIVYNLADIEIVNLQDLKEEVIVIAKDLTPSDTAQMNIDKVQGFATDMGGKTAHTAILARTLEIPAVVGLKKITTEVENNDLLILDGISGTVIINPTEEELNEYKLKQSEYMMEMKLLEEYINLEAITADGRKIEVAANIGTPKDLEGALKHGAEAIGLYRTEFLYMDRCSLPTESEQYEAYKEVVIGMKNRPIIIRTLDVGGDKEIDYLKFPAEMNPFLGWRAIRVCLDIKDLFKTQLKAILRASQHGKVRIMYPMITHVEQVRNANEILEEAKSELRNQNIQFDENIETGIMIETPAAAIIADLLIKEVDFFSIGTNDLTQYTIAVDRGNEKIDHLYNPFHPSVLRLVKHVIDASHKEGKWTGMCGEFAGDEKAAIVLLGLGLDEFSMSATSISMIKRVIRNCTLEKAIKISNHVINLSTVKEVEEYIDEQLNF